MTASLAKPHLLVVDDDKRLRELLQQYLRDNGFAVTVATDAVDARGKLALFLFDLMVLDVMMPSETGIEFARSLQSKSPPILFLTAMAETEDRIAGLEVGGDDYLVKPFDPRELVLRIQAILKRTTKHTKPNTHIYFGDYQFDFTQGRLEKNGQQFTLTTGETQLLKTLAENVGLAVTRETLASALGAGNNERSVDVQITRLRKKIEPDNSKPLYIQTVRGSGYILYANR
jgi:two-component system phosphate regulon response regulator OmpR